MTFYRKSEATRDTVFPRKQICFKQPLSCREGVGRRWVSTHWAHRAYYSDETCPHYRLPRGLLPGMLPATLSGSGPTSQDPFREDAGEKGHREGPRLLFSCNRMTGCWLDTRLTDGISKGFREPSGVGTIITNRASNKARRVTSWKKRSKTNSIILGRHIKIYQANKLQLSAA